MSVMIEMRGMGELWKDGLLSRFFWLQVTENSAENNLDKRENLLINIIRRFRRYFKHSYIQGLKNYIRTIVS